MPCTALSPCRNVSWNSDGILGRRRWISDYTRASVTAGLDAKKAIGSSLAIIAFNSASGLMGQLRFVHIDWRITLWFLIASLAGMGFGVSIVRRVPEQTLRRAFAVALLIIGGVILARVIG